MFCHKCGTQIAEGAGFCHKCGTKTAVGAAAQQTPGAAAPAAGTVAAPPRTPAAPVQTAVHNPDVDAGFREFVDNHVRATTKFQSAEDLLKNSKPWIFLCFCFGIPAVIGLIGGGPLGALALGILLGMIARLIAGFIIRTKYILKTAEHFDGDIDIGDLLQFLCKHLKYLHPYFNEWKYMGPNNLSVTFGAKQRSTAIIHIFHDNESHGSKGMKYEFNSQNNPSMSSRILGWTFFAFLFQINDPQHTCLFKTVPILQAAIKYYLKSKGGAENNVLS